MVRDVGNLSTDESMDSGNKSRLRRATAATVWQQPDAGDRDSSGEEGRGGLGESEDRDCDVGLRGFVEGNLN